jgi:hypothetical protein
MNNYPDTLISVSLDRQAEKVRKVQTWDTGRFTAPKAAWPVGLRLGALAVVAAVAGLAVVYVVH